MPWSLWKDLLVPGTYRLSDGRLVTYTAAQARHAAATGNAQLAAGLRVPTIWDHIPDADPYRPRPDRPRPPNLARDLFADVAGYRVGPGGTLWCRLVGDRDEDRDQFLRVRSVSPKLHADWTDDRGVTWPGLTVAHVAATPRPIQRAQGRPQENPPPHFLAHRLDAKGGRRTDYLAHAERLGADPMEDILAALKSLGVTLPDDGTVTDLETLGVALKVAAAVKTGDDDPGDEGGGGDEGAGGGVTEGSPPPMLMGHLAKLAKSAAKDAGRRVDALFRTGRVDGPTATKLRKALAAASLGHDSLDDQGELNLPVMAKIAAYEELPPGRLTPAGRKAAAQQLGHDSQAAPPPAELDGTAADAERAKVLKRQEELADRYSVRPA